jgi:protein SCO1
MRDTAASPQRRRLLAVPGLWALLGSTLPLAAAAVPTGWLQPRLAAPPLRLTAADGRTVPLTDAVAGTVTAVQLMFTGCNTSCPTQGAFFAELAGRLRSSQTQLLSISIDALGDTPATMTRWQAKFGASPSWRTGVANVADVSPLVDFMKGTTGKGSTHTAQAFIFDRFGRLCYRTGDSPTVAEVEALLARVAQQG